MTKRALTYWVFLVVWATIGILFLPQGHHFTDRLWLLGWFVVWLLAMLIALRRSS